MCVVCVLLLTCPLKCAAVSAAALLGLPLADEQTDAHVLQLGQHVCQLSSLAFTSHTLAILQRISQPEFHCHF
jgi:hypothetical protein